MSPCLPPAVGIEERGYPLSRLQLNQISALTSNSTNLSSGSSLIKGRRLEDEFCRLGQDEEVTGGEEVRREEQIEENIHVLFEGEPIIPEECQGRDWSASSISNYNLLRSQFPCQESGIGHTPPSDQKSLSLLWVWQIGLSSPQCSPAFCSGCQSWGSMSLVKLG